MITHTETIPKQSQAQVTLTARLRLPAGADKRSDITETRLRQDIERLHSRRPPDIGPSAGAPVTAVTLESSGKGKARHYVLSVSADTARIAEVELARLTQALVARHPVTEIAWLDAKAVLDRQTFLDALARPPARPRPTLRTVTDRQSRTTGVPRLRASDAQRQQETLVRRVLCEPIPQEESRLPRRELGLLEPKRRVATAALAFSVTLAVNTTGAVADVMALF